MGVGSRVYAELVTAGSATAGAVVGACSWAQHSRCYADRLWLLASAVDLVGCLATMVVADNLWHLKHTALLLDGHVNKAPMYNNTGG